MDIKAFEKKRCEDLKEIKGGTLSTLGLIYSAWQATPWGAESTWSDANGDGIWTATDPQYNGSWIDTSTGQWYFQEQ